MAVRITAVRKDDGNHYNRHEAVSHYAWRNEQTDKTGLSDRLSMVAWMEEGGQAYVKSHEGQANCFVNRSAYGTKFLQTNADATSANNLLNLPEC
jgi:hypothetical protein